MAKTPMMGKPMKGAKGGNPFAKGGAMSMPASNMGGMPAKGGKMGKSMKGKSKDRC